MTISPRTLRNVTDAGGLALGAAALATSLRALFVAGSWERIMSAYAAQLICGAAFGATATAYFLSS